MKLNQVGGIIAAANKLAKPLMQVGTISIIRRIVISYRQAGIFPIVVITGSDEEEVKKQLSPSGVIFLQNNESDEPQLMESVLTGLGYLHGKCRAVVFTPVNVPMFTPITLTTLINTKGEIVVPSYHGKGGHPVVLSQRIIPEVLNYNGDDGLRGAINSCGDARVWVDVEDKGVVTNIHNEAELLERRNEHNNTIMRPVLHMQLEKELPFFSERLKLLLFLISDTHNMRVSCAYSGIAHSMAWDMINKLEQNLNIRIVERRRGGKDGGSTHLTTAGEEFLQNYLEFESYIYTIAQEEYYKRFDYLI